MKNVFKFLDIKKKILKPLARIAPLSKLRITLLRLSGYSIGKDVFIGEDLIISDNLHDKNVFIGDRVSIAPRVTLVTFSAPNFSRIRPYVKAVNGRIKIENDAWIGAAVVIEDVPPYTVVAGVPAKVIRKLEIEE